MWKKITNDWDLQFSSPLPAACQQQRFMYRDGPPKNHSFCYYRAWAWVSRTPEGSLTWEARLGHRQMAARTFVQAMQANRSGLNQSGLIGLLSLWSTLQPWHSRPYCSEARRTLRDEAKEMPRVFFCG